MKLLLMWFGLVAFFGGFSGAAVGALCAARWWQKGTRAAAPAERDLTTGAVSAADARQVNVVAEQWASARQVPGFSPYAAGYLRDGLEDRRTLRWWRR